MVSLLHRATINENPDGSAATASHSLTVCSFHLHFIAILHCVPYNVAVNLFQ